MVYIKGWTAAAQRADGRDDCIKLHIQTVGSGSGWIRVTTNCGYRSRAMSQHATHGITRRIKLVGQAVLSCYKQVELPAWEGYRIHNGI